MVISVLFSILLFYLSFPNFFFPLGLWPLAWTACIPLLFALENQSLIRRLLTGLLFGFVFYSFLVNWFITYSFVGYLFFVLFLSIQPMIFAILSSSPFKNRVFNLFYYPALWVASEYIRCLIMNGFSWNLGHSQSFNLPFIQISQILGSWGVSFVLILVNTCFYGMIKKSQDRRLCFWVLLLTILLNLVIYMRSILPAGQTDDLKIATIQPSINPHEKLNRARIFELIDEHINLTEELLKFHQPHLIVWPETSIPSDFLRDERMKSKIVQLVKKSQAHLLIGAALREDEKDYNSAVLLNPEGEVLGVYHKQYLVPLSEYLPQGRFWEFLKDLMKIHNYEFTPGNQSGLFSISYQAESVKKVKDVSSQEDRYGVNLRTTKFGVGICSEDTIGLLMRQLSERANFIIILLNDGWFSDNVALIMHAQNAIMHAVENRIPVIRAANTGWACYISPIGVIDGFGMEQWLGSFIKKGINFQSFNRRAYRVYQFEPIKTHRSIYSIIGDVFCWLCIFVVIIGKTRSLNRKE